jgi:hypothetical protein
MVKRKSVDAGLEDIEVKVKKVTMGGKKGTFLSPFCLICCIENGWLCLSLGLASGAQMVGDHEPRGSVILPNLPMRHPSLTSLHRPSHYISLHILLLFPRPSLLLPSHVQYQPRTSA